MHQPFGACGLRGGDQDWSETVPGRGAPGAFRFTLA
jgi:hypothetical protein